MSESITLRDSDKQVADQQHQEALGVLEELDGLEVETQEDLEFAAETLQEIKGHAKKMKEMQDSVVRPLNEAINVVRSWFKPGLTIWEKCETILKKKISDGHDRAYERQRQALDEAAKASMEGDVEKAADAMERATRQDFAPVAGLSMRTAWDFEITDFDKVPREYLLVDEKKVRAMIKAARGDINIDGIKVIRNSTVASSSR